MASQLRQRQKGIPFGSIEYALKETQELLLAGLHDMCTDVLCAAISGLGHRPHPLALPELIKLSFHPDRGIRFEVAVALGSYSEADSIDALLRLAKDDSDAVRDWATFGIGSMQEVDDSKVRDLLWANLQDKDEDLRGEALVGLAIRKDERIIAFTSEMANIRSGFPLSLNCDFRASVHRKATCSHVKNELECQPAESERAACAPDRRRAPRLPTSGHRYRVPQRR